MKEFYKLGREKQSRSEKTLDEKNKTKEITFAINTVEKSFKKTDAAR